MPIKAYIDIACGLLIVAFLAWVFHEGEKRIEDADVRAVQAQVIHNDEINKAAQSAIQAAEEHYRAIYAAPPIAPVHVSVCEPARTGTLSSAAAGANGTDAAPDVSAAMGQTRDIGPDTDHLLDQADAQIEALQAVVRVMQQQMENAH